MAQEWDLNVLAAMDKANKLQNNTSGVDNTVMPTNVADTFGLTKGGQKQQQPQSDLYALQEKKRIAALEAQKRSALASLKTEKQQINPAFNTALSNVAGQSARQARNLAEYLAQRGQTQSGIAAQSEMQRYSDLMGQQGLLEQQRTSALSDIAQRQTQVQGVYDEGALQALLDRQIGETAYQQQLAEQQRAESINTVGQYGQDYAAEINRIQSEIASGNNSRAYLLPYLQMAMQDKVAGIQQAQAEQKQQEFENWLAMQKLRKTGSSGGGSVGGGVGGLSLTPAQARDAMDRGIINEATVASFNSHYGTNYTVDEARRIFNNITVYRDYFDGRDLLNIGNKSVGAYSLNQQKAGNLSAQDGTYLRLKDLLGR